MVDSCATCFAFKTQSYINSAGSTASYMACKRKAPSGEGGPTNYKWPKVEPTDWCVDFVTDYDTAIQTALNAALEQIAAAAGTGGFSTGDGKLTLKTSPDTGFVMADDGTIGDGSSGASNRANDDTHALFLLLYNFSDADCPVPGGRGASAAADWTAHKKITLTKELGRAITIAGAGAGLTPRTLGNAYGAETTAVGDHTHSVTITNKGGATSGADLDNIGGAGDYSTTPAGSANVAIVSPSSAWNIMIKL